MGSQKVHESRLQTIRRALSPWGVAMFPISLRKLTFVAAALLAGDFKSADAYVSA